MATGYTLIGNTVTLESSVPIVDPQNGLFWKEVYVGPQDSLYTQRGLLNIQPDQRVDIQPRNGPIYAMTVITPDYVNGQSSALEKFDLIRHDVEKSIVDHTKAVGLIAGEAVVLRNLIRDKIKLENIEFGSDDSAYIFSKLLLGGGTAKFLGFERTFKFSIITSGRYGTLLSEFGVDKLWTAAQIANPAFSGIVFPANIRFSLLVIDSNAPANINKSIDAPGRNPMDSTDKTYKLTEVYSWKWLKVGGEVENLPSGKLRLNQEFMGDLWSTWEYPLVT